jgi:hypothetical protein
MHDGLTVTRKVLKTKNEGWKTNKKVNWKSKVRTVYRNQRPFQVQWNGKGAAI